MSRRTNRGTIFLTDESKYDSLRCKGDVKAEGRISAESVNIKGKLTADSEITADKSFDFKGRISAGNITARHVRIITGSDGNAGNITGGNVFIRCGLDPVAREEFLSITERILDIFHINGTKIREAAEKADAEKNEQPPVFTCGEISGTDIELHGVTCKSVTGENITLNDGCNIGEVSYTGSYTADDSCVVGKSERA